MMPQQPRADKAGRLQLGLAPHLFGSHGVHGTTPWKCGHCRIVRQAGGTRRTAQGGRRGGA
jgi:hypothetical protein